jgi:Domain of unknown function (DUF4157)
MGNQRLIQTQTAANDRKHHVDKRTKQSEHPMQEVLGSRAASRQFRAQLQRHQAEGASSPNPLHSILPSISPVSPRAIQAKPMFRGLSHELTPTIGSDGMVIQAKMTIGAPGDQYEQEADRVAEQVVQKMQAPSAPESILGEPLQRQKREEDSNALRMKPLAQRPAVGGMAATQDLESSINRARGGGQPLEAGLQRKLGQAMGADFSEVRVHTDHQADQLNRSIQAKAFTTGQDVFFRQGVYQPGSRKGQELIAHELMHVVQQSGGAVQRSPQPQESQYPATEAAELLSEASGPSGEKVRSNLLSTWNSPFEGTRADVIASNPALVNGCVIQRELAEFQPSANDLSAEVEREELKRHVTETVGEHGTFKDEATKLSQLLGVLEVHLAVTGAKEDAKSIRENINTLSTNLNAEGVANEAVKTKIKEIVDLSTLWGGMAGVTDLIKSQARRFTAMIEIDADYKNSRNRMNVSTKVDHYEKWHKEFRQLSFAAPANVFEKAKTFHQWVEKNKGEYYEFNLDIAKEEVKSAEEKESTTKEWKNEFFFPKVRSKLGLPQGSGQQNYTADKPYDDTYDWHISVAFQVVNEKKQLVKINRIHFSFKHKTDGGDRSVWFSLVGNRMSVASEHGGGPTAHMIDFAKTKVRQWAETYTQLELNF